MSVKVSVIIPVYNAEKYLAQCLDSVLSQSLSDMEVICVDDGSSDGSAKIIAGYAAADGRIKKLEQENSGAGSARNAGLAAAEGEYVLFLDADDWFEPDYMESAYQRASETGADICISRGVMFDDASGAELPSEWMLRTEYLPGMTFAPEEAAEHIFQFTYGQVWDKLFRRAFLEEKGLRFPALRAAEDTAFAYESVLSAGKISILPQTTVHYRVNRRGSVSKSFAENPKAPLDAFELVYDFLNGNSLFKRYEKSFLNWAMEYLVWQVNNASDTETRKIYLRELRDRWLPELRLNEYSLSCFENRATYLKYLLAAHMPERMYLSAMSSYKHMKNGK